MMSSMMYLGPTLMSYGIKEGAIFTGSNLPKNVEDLMERSVNANLLTVRLTDVVAVRRKINTVGTVESDAYKQLQQGRIFPEDPLPVPIPLPYVPRADKSRGYNVVLEGAKGDGKTDDTTALQNAINSAYKKGFEGIYLPRGKYRTTRPLILPEMERPNTAASQGKGFIIIGDGIYDTGIVYTGTEYAIYSDKEMAEGLLLQDFYINHRNGGGVRIPQGAHQMFVRFFSSSCGEGYRGVWIEGWRAWLDPVGGYGSYMVSFRNCRFWEETGYRGTGVRIENSILCTTLDNCFFSRSVRNYPHCEIVNSSSVNIITCAFERTEQYVQPADPANGRTEEMVKQESIAANSAMTAPLIMLEGCHAINIESSHAEATYEAFVGIKGHTAGVRIDGCRLDHYALTPFNPNKGYIVVVDPESTYSRDIIVGPRNYRVQSNNPDTTHGSMIVDPVGCVTVENFHDFTPFQNNYSNTERRTVPYIGKSGANLLQNPSFRAMHSSGVPHYLEMVDGDWSFSQLPYISGCNMKQAGEAGPKYRLRTRTVESLNKHDFYSVVLTGRNRLGKSCELYVDIGGDTNDMTFIIPSGNERFTLIKQFKGQATDIVDVVTYAPLDLDVYALYLIPGIVSEVPYGSESQSVSKLKAVDINVAAIKLETVNELPPAGWSTRGYIMRKEAEGADDQLVICKRLADGSFNWVELGV
jgi:hypothetical protein